MRPSPKEVAVDEKSTEVKSNCEPYLPKRSIIKITKNTQIFSFSDIQKIRLSKEKVSAIRHKMSDGRATVDIFLLSTINCPYGSHIWKILLQS